MNQNRFYITTPIYYITAKPHLGTLYATLIADVLARFNALCGKEVHFITGTDEHGQKIAQAAAHAHMQPQEFVDSLVPAYQEIWRLYDINYNYFMRTTAPFHKKSVQELVLKLLHSGAIYKSHYHGWYCTPCETFVSEHSDAQTMPLCNSCGRETKYVSEESYFFRLSAYTQRLLDFYETHPDFIMPRERAHEVISFVKSGLKDLSISRTTVAWGVPFPEDQTHTIYVWIDALCNYITAIGYTHNMKEFAHWWPADVHVLGKDIIKFHAVYWPALLMAADLALPKKLLVHGWIQINNQKMSKSFGNAVNPVELANQYGVDQVRYYLLRSIPVNQDGEFSTADLEQRIAADLADDLGNLLQRLVILAKKHGAVQIHAPQLWSEKAVALRSASWDMITTVNNYMDDGMFHLALARVWEYIAVLNGYFHEHEPWKVVHTDRALFNEILSATAHGLYVVGFIMQAFMPKKAGQLLFSLGCLSVEGMTLDKLSMSIWQYQFHLTPIPVLFEKIQSTEAAPQVTESAPVVHSQPGINVPVSASEHQTVTIDEFARMELRVGTIESAVEVPKSDKLLVLKVNFGSLGVRQIVSGIKKSFTPDVLVGKQAVFIYNLPARKMMGLESQGMLLVAKDSTDTLVLSTVAAPIENGSRLS